MSREISDTSENGIDVHSRGNDDENVHPYTEVSKPPELSQGTDLANEEASDRENEQANDETQIFLRELTDTLAIAENEQADVQEELQALEDVDKVSRPLAVNAESNVSVVFHGVAITVEGKKHFPELPARAKNTRQLYTDVHQPR